MCCDGDRRRGRQQAKGMNQRVRYLVALLSLGRDFSSSVCIGSRRQETGDDERLLARELMSHTVSRIISHPWGEIY